MLVLSTTAKIIAWSAVSQEQAPLFEGIVLLSDGSQLSGKWPGGKLPVGKVLGDTTFAGS